MAVTVYHTGAAVLGEDDANPEVSAHHVGASVALERTFDDPVRIRSMAIQVMYRADVNGANGRIHPANMRGSEGTA